MSGAGRDSHVVRSECGQACGRSARQHPSRSPIKKEKAVRPVATPLCSKAAVKLLCRRGSPLASPPPPLCPPPVTPLTALKPLCQRGLPPVTSPLPLSSRPPPPPVTPPPPPRPLGACRRPLNSSGLWEHVIKGQCIKSTCLHTSAYVSIRQHASACVSIRQRTSAYVSMRQRTSACVSIRQHTSAYVSIRQHTSAQ
jgi:hypothetical protein